MTVFEVKEKGYTEVHKREQFTNELALVDEDGRLAVPRYNHYGNETEHVSALPDPFGRT